MGMVKAGEFLQQSYVAVGGSDIHVDLLLFSQEKFIQDYHLESADTHRWTSLGMVKAGIFLRQSMWQAGIVVNDTLVF